MALSLDSIHQPLNDFFLNRFKFDAKSPVVFRLDKFGSVLSDQDFMDSRKPGEYSPNLATEKFSYLVNKIPIEDADGLNIFLSQAQIDLAYQGLLNSSVPFIPEGTDAETGEGIITSFSRIKSDALKLWNNIKLESSSGLLLDFKPSLAGPKDWYDKNNKDNWTAHSFQVTETAKSAASKSLVFVEKIDDAKMERIVPSVDADKPVAPAQLAATLLTAHPNRPVMTTPRMVMASLQTAADPPRTSAKLTESRRQPRMAVRDHRGKKGKDAAVKPGRDRQPPRTRDAAGVVVRNRKPPRTPNTAGGVVRDHRGKDAAGNFGRQDRYLRRVRKMPLHDRIAVLQYISRNAPTKPATTNSFSISFDYCLVNINRPWYRPDFISNPSWYVPNTTKGQLTAPVNSGANLILMPVGVVAIRNLNIRAHWSDADRANAKNATSLGPFKVDGITDNSLSHAGIQIIGWLLERMPDLPPNGSPKPKQG